MTVQKSKRQQRRSRNSSSSRSITIGVIVFGALLIAIALIYPNIKSPSEVVVPEQITRSNINGLTVGNVTSPAKIEVFEDFQCPACVRFTQDIEPLVLSQLVETGKAYYVFHNYPFLDKKSDTKESQDSANASLCANEQGKFWEYHDTLFANWNGENQGNLSKPRLIQFASAVELNVDDFSACVNENRYAIDVQASFDLGNSMGVSGTPSVFVNGQQISPGYVPAFKDIAAAVEAVQ
jgi:protein-disulfide isomerase